MAEAAPPDDPNFMLSLARGLQLMEALAGPGGPWTVARLVRATGLGRGAVTRCLHTLQKLGYIDQQENQFALSVKVLTLSNGFARGASLPVVAQPWLDKLADQTGYSCSLGVRTGDQVTYVARAARNQLLSVDLQTGSHLPLWCTSMGRVLLAGQPVAERAALLPPDPLPRLTPHSAPDRQTVLAAVAEAERAGYAIVDQELAVGLISLAVPVRRASGATVAALNVGAHALAVRPAALVELQAVLAAAAEAIGQQLSHHGL